MKYNIQSISIRVPPRTDPHLADIYILRNTEILCSVCIYIVSRVQTFPSSDEWQALYGTLQEVRSQTLVSTTLPGEKTMTLSNEYQPE